MNTDTADNKPIKGGMNYPNYLDLPPSAVPLPDQSKSDLQIFCDDYLSELNKVSREVAENRLTALIQQEYEKGIQVGHAAEYETQTRLIQQRVVAELERLWPLPERSQSMLIERDKRLAELEGKQ